MKKDADEKAAVDLKAFAMEAVAAPLRYEIAHAQRREAYEKYNGASLLLNLRKIEERAAELESQHEPMGAFCSSDRRVRAAILRAVRYVVYGHEETEA